LPDWEIEKIKVLIRVREHALLYGPPGSGKSHLAKELAKNVSVAYISVSLGEEIFSGSGKAKCDNLLREAKEVLENQKKKAENDPDQKINPVVIIVDEIDSIGVKSFSPGRNGAETTNNFLGIINNIEDQKLNIRVIGITNYHEVLDPAVVRCGRLGFQIEINYPQQEEELNRIVDHLVKDKEFIKETEKLSINFAEDYWNEVKKITWEEKEKCSPETGISLIDIKKALSRSWCKEGISDANSAEAYRFWLQDIIKGKPKPRRGDIGLETILNPLASFFSGRREFSES
jgi:SpoVK/Ycf46/Vps4 family AAA+-type ATPase